MGTAKKQAVVLIHGVGEQVPMDTLRGFVQAVWTTDSSLRRPNVPSQAWSKPDRVSGDFELRRMTTAENRDGKRTDFLEFYWAHLMEGTTLSHVGAWVEVLILRWPWHIPRQLRGIWSFLVFLIVLAALFGLNQIIEVVPIAPWALKAVWFAWFIFGSSLVGLLIHVAGDAARYLHVAPPNIEIRRRIREAGIELLEKLHSSTQYDRIIVVGHSLGSVIGYDILTHLWTRYHETHVGVEGSDAQALDAVEALAREAETGNLNLDQYQCAQSDYLEELQRQGNKWRVTDFVTLGSPLAHALVLLARNEREFARKKDERQFPTCPPVLEEITKNKSSQRKFSFLSDKIWVPHHAALFAATSWTNLYFPCQLTLWGDLIGGPLAPAFGPGIRDIAVKTTLRTGLFSHTQYWSFPKKTGDCDAPPWIKSLQESIRICLAPPASQPTRRSRDTGTTTRERN